MLHRRVVGTLINVGADTSTSTPLYVLAGILLGGIVGEIAGIERRLESLGDRIQERLAGEDGHSTVSEGFVTASLLFCAGSLTVVGSIQDGLTGDYELLATKPCWTGSRRSRSPRRSAGASACPRSRSCCKDVKVGNFLPALVIAPALVGLVSLF